MIKKLLNLKHSVLLETELDMIKKLDTLLEKAAIKKLGKKNKIIYAAAFLTNEGKNDLKNWWESNVREPLFPRLFLHHMTIKWKPSLEEVLSLPIGEEVMLNAVGYAASGDIQAVAISTDLPVSNKIPHITISANEGISPVKLNDLLDNGFISIEGLELRARIGYWDGKEAIYEYPEEDES